MRGGGILILVLIGWLLSACSSSDAVLPTLFPTFIDPTVIPATATAPVAETPATLSTTTTVEVENSATPDPTDERVIPTAVVTPEVIPPDQLMTPGTNLLALAVSYAVDEGFPATYPAAPTGQTWIVVAATITNSGANALTFPAQALELIDAEGRRYPSELPDQFVSPSLIGTSIPANDSFLGLVRFAIPVGSQASQLALCQDVSSQPCVNWVEAPIP
jgi:hypothetical protein